MIRSSTESLVQAEIAPRVEETDARNEFPRAPRPPPPPLVYVSAGTQGGRGVPPQ